MFFGNASDQADDLITRDIIFAQPVVTTEFMIIVKESCKAVVLKIDVIGMSPEKKYDTDPVLNPAPYEDGNYMPYILLPN